MKTHLSSRYKTYALIVLTCTYMVSFLDRIMIGILLQPIKEDLQLSDTQLGFLTGIAFAVFYATLGIPMARWADKGNRVTIASLAIGAWGVMMLMTGFVTSFFQLLVVRIGAAVGEAGIFPPSFSLLSDYFSGKEQNKAFSIFMLGLSICLVIGYLIAGWVNQYYGWRMAFIVVAIPGFMLSLLIKLTLREPRKEIDNTNTPKEVAPPLRETFRHLWGIPTYRNIVMAYSMVNFVSIGVLQWCGAFFIRNYGMETAELGLWFGILGGGAGIGGTLMGGYIFDRFFTGNYHGFLRFTAIGVCMLFPCMAIMVWVPHKMISLMMLMPIIALGLFIYGPITALWQYLIHGRIRAVSQAITALVLNLIGMGLGPQAVGILSDYFNPTMGVSALSLAMVIATSAAFGAAFFFWRASNSVDADMASAMKNNKLYEAVGTDQPAEASSSASIILRGEGT